VNIGGRLHADLKPVAGVILVYLNVHAADVDVVAPEDFERRGRAIFCCSQAEFQIGGAEAHGRDDGGPEAP